jgi:hypothetical protein
LLVLGGDDSSNDKVQSEKAVDKHYWHFGRGENGTSFEWKKLRNFEENM